MTKKQIKDFQCPKLKECYCQHQDTDGMCERFFLGKKCNKRESYAVTHKKFIEEQK